MNTWAQKRREMNESLKQRVVPLLRNMGFKGSFPHFRRISPERVDTIGFQYSQWGPQFYVEVGVAERGGVTLLDGTHFPPMTLKHYQCPARARIGQLPFDFDEQSAVSVADATRDSIEAAASIWESLYHTYSQE